MTSKRILYLTLLLTAISTIIQAQTPVQNLGKYWNYRERLVGTNGQGGFLDVGIGQGMSLPASERNPYASCKWDWYLNNNNCETRKGKGRLHWGDATIYHGYYLAVLALEYANLEKTGQSITAVAEELWYALLTVERLDSMAEVVFGKEGKLDGFFLRDDIPADFYKKKGAPKGRRFARGKNCFDCLSSALSCDTLSVRTGGFISQDQVLGLFLGFSMIDKLVADKRYKDSLPTFGEKTAIIVHRIANYMMTNSWKLRGPNGQRIPDEWGGNTIGLSFPIAQIANRLTNKKYEKNYIRKGALFLGRPIYDLLQLFLSAQHQTNVGLALSSHSMMEKRSHNALARKSKKHDAIIYPLLHAVFFDRTLSKKIKKSDFEALINEAPYDGPCFGTPDCDAPDGWKSYDRWVHPRFKNGNPYGVKSETPGLDFMILYNLYYYYYSPTEKLPVYRNEVMDF
jgi:hypothetical protein